MKIEYFKRNVKIHKIRYDNHPTPLHIEWKGRKLNLFKEI